MKNDKQQGAEGTRLEKLMTRLEHNHLHYTEKQSGGSTVVKVRAKEMEKRKDKVGKGIRSR